METYQHQPQLDRGEEYTLGAPHLLMGDPTQANGEGMMDFGQIPEATVMITPSVATASDVGGHQIAEATYGRGARASIDLVLNDAQAAALAALVEGATQPTETFTITSINDTADPAEFEVDDSNDDLTGWLEVGDVIAVDDTSSNDGTYVVAAKPTHSSGTTSIPVEESLSSETISGSPTVTHFHDGLTFDTNERKIDPPTAVIVPNKYRESSSIIDEPLWWFPAVVNRSEVSFPMTDSEGEDANETYEPSLSALLRKYDQAGTLLPQQVRKAFKLSPNRVAGATLGWSLPTPLRDVP